MLVRYEPISTLSVSAAGWGSGVMKQRDLPYLALIPVPTNPGEAVKIPYLPQKADPNRQGYLLVFPSGPFPVCSVDCFLHRQEAKNRAGPLESGCLAL